MRIIFVGMHNKPGINPLCPSTKTGKMVNRVIKATMEGDTPPDRDPITTFTFAEIRIDILKTNLYDVEEYPEPQHKPPLARDWTFRIIPELDDIIVLLGAEVHKNYIDTVGEVIKVAHPASKWSHVDMDAYVESISTKINESIKKLYRAGKTN